MTEVRLPAPVKATLVADVDAQEAAPGAFEIVGGYKITPAGRAAAREVAVERPAGMFYVCPCGCGSQGYLAFRPAPSPSWEWDGNREAPTLSPSVHHVGHWHGWLKAGAWIQAA